MTFIKTFEGNTLVLRKHYKVKATFSLWQSVRIVWSFPLGVRAKLLWDFKFKCVKNEEMNGWFRTLVISIWSRRKIVFKKSIWIDYKFSNRDEILFQKVSKFNSEANTLRLSSLLHNTITTAVSRENHLTPEWIYEVNFLFYD